MPVVTLDPVSQGTYSDWVSFTGSSRPVALSDASDATYLQWADSDGPAPAYPLPVKDSFFLSGIAAVALSSVNTVSAFGRNGISTHLRAVYARIGTTNGDNLEQTRISPSIGNHGGVVTRPGGGPWMPDDVAPNNLQVVCEINSPDGTQTTRWYKAWMEVDFNPSSNFFAVITQALLPIVGVAGTLRAVEWLTRGRMRFRNEEIGEMVEALRQARSRRVFLGA